MHWGQQLIQAKIGDHTNSYHLKVKGAAPLCNLSVWEPRFGEFTWGWGPGWYHQGPAKGPR